MSDLEKLELVLESSEITIITLNSSYVYRKKSHFESWIFFNDFWGSFGKLTLLFFRDSTSIAGDYVLCVKEDAKVSHYIINKIQQG